MRIDGVERLIANLPGGDPDNLNDLRSFTIGLTRAVTSWQVRKGQRRQDNRLQGWGR
jgi:hypothetical protein